MDGVEHAWQRFCDGLQACGERIAAAGLADDPTTRAEGYRHLARLAVMALQGELEYADTTFPAFHRYDDDVVQWGGPNADNHYLRAAIDPAGTYRIAGEVAGVRELIVSTHEGDMQLDEYGVFEERRLGELTVADGRLELRLGGPQPLEEPANWIPLDPAARFVMIRVYVSDWIHDGLAWFDIERLDRDVDAPPPVHPIGIAAALDAATRWIERSIAYWPDYLDRSPARRFVNTLTPPRHAPGGSDQILYGAGWWDLAPGRCLAIEFTPPRADYWSIQLYSAPWFESLDLRNRVTSHSGETTVLDTDGRARIAIAAEDPAVANWLDTEGRPAGLVAYRWVWTRDAPVPIAHELAIRDLAAHWPDTMRLDEAPRAEQRRRRRLGMARRYHR